MTDPTPILVDRRGGVLRITLNRPDRLNAVDLPLYNGLAETLRNVADEDGVRAVVLTGAGRAFCVGADLKAYDGRGRPTAPARRRYVRAGQQANRLLQACPRPVIAAVNGHAVGAGLELALSADLIVVAREAKLRFPEVGLGTFIGGGVTYTLPQRVGLARAKELILLGRFFHGADAVALGLANRAVPGDEVLDTALALAAELARKAPLSVRLAKRLLNGAADRPSDATLAAEADALLECMETRDWEEGVAAFAEDREPRFTGE